MPDIRGLAATIKERVSAWDMGVQMGLSPDRDGYCRCPFHAEKTGSLRLYKQGRRGWYCYGCHQGGSVLDLVMQYYKLDLWGAILHIDAALHLGLPLLPPKPLTAREKREADCNRRLDQSRRETEELWQKAALEAFWAAGDLFNQIDAEVRTHVLRGLYVAQNEDFWRLVKLREDAREAMEDMAVYAIGGDKVGLSGKGDLLN